MADVKAIPEGHHTLTAHIIVSGGAEAIEFYKKAFGAEEIGRMNGPDGKSVMHAEMKIGDSRLMLADEFPAMGSRSPKSIGGSPVTIHLYVQDVDAVYNRAVAAGATATMPVMDMFWGDRYGKLRDPFGHDWSIATHKKDVSTDEIIKAGQAMFKEMGK
jgi:uncharacterized glyoxalase superfamily protein PhnB